MKTRLLLILLAVVLCGRPALAGTTVGLILPNSCGLDASAKEAFGRHLVDAGLEAGEVEILLQRPEDDRISRVQSVQKLLAHDVDILVTYGSATALDAVGESGKTPVIVLGAADPLQDGLVESEDEPGGNVTGVKGKAPLFTLLGMIQTTAAPSVLGVLHNSNNLESRHDLAEIRELTAKMDLEVVEVDIKTSPPEELAGSFGEATFVLMTSGCPNLEESLAELAKANIPMACRSRGHSGQGIVFLQSLNHEALLAAAAGIALRVIRGVKPGNIAMQTVETTDFVVDLKEAKRLGVKIPFSVLKKATSVIK